MRFSLYSVTALFLASSSLLALAGADANAQPKPDTTPDSPPTQTARQVKARESSPNLLAALYKLASDFDLRACVPRAFPLVTTLPKIPPGLLAGDAVSQALSQTSRQLDEVCDFSITGSAGDTFTSFLPTWYSWYHRYSDRVADVVTKCPMAGPLVKTVEAYESCPQVMAQITQTSADASTSQSTSTTTTGGDESVPTTASSETVTTASDSPGTGENGFFGAAAAAAAGVLGVVAVL
ncbi:hypothetical protein F4802DRAFT_196133 [Xylaria palmicola]|nr:hypothetical protein F4802DRAFT_196133 [Xylaria palmicola]